LGCAHGPKLIAACQTQFLRFDSVANGESSVRRDLAVSNCRARHKTRRFLPSSALTLAGNHAASLHPLPAHRQIRAIPRFYVTHNRPPARRARLPFVPNQQVLDHPVELRMFIAA
jgi:hypothetical protein